MSENSLTPEQMNAILQYASKRLGMSPENLAQTVQSGGLAALANKLPAKDAAKLDAVVGDKSKAEALLRSPEAQKLMQQLLQNKK